MTRLGIALIAVISIATIIAAIRQPGGALRYSFLCGGLYLFWIVPQLVGLNGDISAPDDGLLWLAIMALLCLVASLIGWHIGLRRSYREPAALTLQAQEKLFWPALVLTIFMIFLTAMIGLQPLEAREQAQWSGPLTIITFFLSLSVMGLYLSAMLFLKEKSLRTFLLVSANVLIIGSSALISIRRGEIVDFGITAIAVLWFGLRKPVPIALLAAGIVGVAVVSYAISPLRSAANEIEMRTGRSVGLLSIEVWEAVDFSTIEESTQRAVDLANAAHRIDYTNKWGGYTLGQASWNRLIFQWVPAQILSTQFKNSLMFEQGGGYEQIEAEYGYSQIGGTTQTGFGFAYQEFGLGGFLYFFLIGIIMGRLWVRANVGDIWAQVLYVSLANPSLHAVTHHPMRFYVIIPLFVTAVIILKKWPGIRGYRTMAELHIVK